MTTVREGTVRAGPWQLHTRTAAPATPDPSAPTVVLLHGLGMSARSLVPTMERLARDVTALAPDLPGFGHSPRPAHALQLPALAEAVVAFLDALALPKVSLLGHSLGCQVAAHVADRRPDRVACLVLTSPCRDPHAPWPWQQAVRLVRDAPQESPALLPVAAVDYLRAGPARMWRTLREAMTTDARDRLRQISVPTLVVRGERDPVVSARWAQEVTDLLACGRLVTLPGAPHGLPFSAAGQLVELALPFLLEHG